MKFNDLTIKRFILSEIQENCYVVSLRERDDCVIVDPGIGSEIVARELLNNDLRPSAILITHGHFDHIAGIPAIRKIWSDVPIYVGERDRSKLTDPNANLSTCFGFSFALQDDDFQVLHENDLVEAAGLIFKTIDVPGHSVGHVAYILETDERPVVFCGDVVFAGSIGRTDFPDGNQDELTRNIRHKLLSLSDQTLLCVGHGSVTTAGNEKTNNPYL